MSPEVNKRNNGKRKYCGHMQPLKKNKFNRVLMRLKMKTFASVVPLEETPGAIAVLYQTEE
jgi:hypothetical protein